MKVCTQCNIEKELDQFHKRKRAKNGLQSYCKVCACKNNKLCYEANDKNYYKTNKEKIRISSKQYHQANKEIQNSKVFKRERSISPGVYMLRNLINGKRYIGQSIMPYKRHTNHMWIRKKKIESTNEWMQEDLKKYGRQAFVFGIIEHCTIEELLIKEEYYIKQLQPEYNKILL